MRQMLLSFLSKEQRYAVEPYITRAELNNDSATIEEPKKGTKEVTIQEAGALLAHAVTVRLCQEATPFREEPIVPFAWLCVAQEGFDDPLLEEMLDATMSTLRETWPSRLQRKPRAKTLHSIKRIHPPALVTISGGKMSTAPDVVPRYIAQMEGQGMFSPYARSSRLRLLAHDPENFSTEYDLDPNDAIEKLARLVVQEVTNGSYEPHTLVVFDGDDLPEPLEHLASIVTALTAMSPAAELSPALNPHRVGVFPVVTEKP